MNGELGLIIQQLVPTYIYANDKCLVIEGFSF